MHRIDRPEPAAVTPPLADVLASLRVVSLPLVTRFRGVDHREAALIEGPEGWAEFSPFLEYGDEEAATWLSAALDFAWQPQPKALRTEIPVNATMPAVAADRVPEVLARYDGCRTVKVKVAEPGQTLDDDVTRVRAVRAAMGPEGRIRVDANGGWNVDEAEHAAHALAEFDLEYLEQPCATVDELAELRERLHRWDLPIAADESVRKAQDPIAVARAGAADLIVVKAQPLGGVRRALEIVAEAGLPAVVSSALDTSIGLSQGAALAAALPELDFDCGLGTASLLAADVVRDPLVPRGGVIPVGRLTPDPALLDQHAASPERREWWLERIERCYAVLAGRGEPEVPASTR
ncbi:o-succinylbenzoate synthase [Microbacterium paludicola]|uniref:o-succinylbenzoate synthase n=1 Tax=Microbacterium paludicola TaxID=300019 RepID=UPI00387927AC